jgi:hypothetical protein
MPDVISAGMPRPADVSRLLGCPRVVCNATSFTDSHPEMRGSFSIADAIILQYGRYCLESILQSATRMSSHSQHIQAI